MGAGRFLAVLCGLALFVGPSAAAQAPAEAPPQETPDLTAPPQVDVAAGILIDLDTGEVIWEEASRAIRAPASLTKVVTALVVRDRYPLDEEVSATDRAAAETGSRLGLETGYSLTVNDLLYGLLIDSGNDVATAFADHHPGGHDAFIELMNEKARALGAYDSHFANAHGLDAEGHQSTAWDMAIFGKRLLADPVLAEVVRADSYSVPWPDEGQLTFRNHNKLIDRYPDVTGMKTGFTNNAGHSLIASVDAPEGRFLSVVMGAADHYGATAALFDHAKAKAIAPAPDVGTASNESEAAEAGAVLGTPPPPPRAVPESVAAAATASSGPGEDGALWAALMAVLAAGMLLTMLRGRRAHPLREAAQFHPFLEPLCPRSASNGSGAGRKRPTSARAKGSLVTRRRTSRQLVRDRRS